jgi:hypothetical protein
MKLGDTFLMRTPGYSVDHLWIVISDPSLHSGTFIIVNLTTDVARASADCELIPGCHPWVVKKCYVNFADALKITPELEGNIAMLRATKAVLPHDPLDPKIVATIIQVAKKSKAFPPTFRIYL